MGYGQLVLISTRPYSTRNFSVVNLYCRQLLPQANLHFVIGQILL